MNWIVTKLIRWIGGRFDGYKTKIGGVGLILTGVISAINLVWPDTVPGAPMMDLDGIIAAIGGGLVALGIGGKIDKNTAAVKESASAQTAAQDSIQ